MDCKIIQGDSLDILKTLPDVSIQCCVTSPPYYGLRDYGVDGQVGLEETPEAYVAKLVAVFREVRRVLREDGTLWLNLGDSYYKYRPGKGQTLVKQTVASNDQDLPKVCARRGNKLNGLKEKDLIGIPWRVAFALQQPYEIHVVKSVADRAYLAGLIDGEGCITILRTKSSHCESYSYPPIVQVRMCDTESIDYFAELMGVNRSNAELYNSHKEANQRPSYNVKVTAQKAMDLIADIYPFIRVKRKQAVVAYNHQLLRNETNYQPQSEEQIKKEEFCKELINNLNQRNSVDIPSWMIEPRFKVEQGWYLRQDLIWHKPNPMPESVKDRCTKSHEYIFLLTKSSKYFYDADAIKEPAVQNRWGGHKPMNVNNSKDIDNQFSGLTRERDMMPEYRNCRDVWSVVTKPYKGAHFATFPEKLIEPCIKAGCPIGGIVIDPFFGAGTVGVVAKKLGREYIGIELNPIYIEIAEKRIVEALNNKN